MNSAMAGMKGTLTALLRRIETLESGQMQQSLGACVATKEALHLPGRQNQNTIFEHFDYLIGMDAWCSENCRKGNCPSHLCSCPVKKLL